MPRRSLGANYRKLFAATTISNLGDGVGVIAYPWLASAITRSPLLIALVAVAQRLPWLLFTLPAGVITDRHDRRTLMVGANAVRAVLTFAVAAAVLARQGTIPAPDDVEQVVDTEWLLYLAVIVATLLLGVCEVLYDNSAQTFMPAIVETAGPRAGNGRMYSAELVANQFIGPPLASLLLLVGFALPLFFDAATFAVSAALVFAIVVTPRPPAAGAETVARRPWRSEAAEGFRWLWRHDVIRTLAISLGALNLLGTMSTGLLVLFGQEVLNTSVTEFALLSTAAAIGGVVGGWTASAVSKRLGSGGIAGADAVGRGRHLDPHRLHLVLADRGRADGHHDLHRHHVERHHGELPAIGHPGPPARAREQRLPLLRMGRHPDRRLARRTDRRRARRSVLSRGGPAGAVDHRRRGAAGVGGRRRPQAHDGASRGRQSGQ